jgi:fatty-acyl-CoA synthase
MAKAVRDFRRGRTSRHKIPRHVAFVSTYPMTASGQIQIYQLVELSKILFAEQEKKA